VYNARKEEKRFFSILWVQSHFADCLSHAEEHRCVVA